jgi:hypothetical protein
MENESIKVIPGILSYLTSTVMGVVGLLFTQLYCRCIYFLLLNEYFIGNVYWICKGIVISIK